MNAPDRFELFLGPEETKLVYSKDTKIKDAASFVINKEDHTLGNILRMQLLRDKNVLFAGYQMPHPLEQKVIVKIQTTSVSSPLRAMDDAINDLADEVSLMQERFKNELEKKKNPETEHYL